MPSPFQARLLGHGRVGGSQLRCRRRFIGRGCQDAFALGFRVLHDLEMMPKAGPGYGDVGFVGGGVVSIVVVLLGMSTILVVVVVVIVIMWMDPAAWNQETESFVFGRVSKLQGIGCFCRCACACFVIVVVIVLVHVKDGLFQSSGCCCCCVLFLRALVLVVFLGRQHQGLLLDLRNHLIERNILRHTEGPEFESIRIAVPLFGKGQCGRSFGNHGWCC